MPFAAERVLAGIAAVAVIALSPARAQPAPAIVFDYDSVFPVQLEYRRALADFAAFDPNAFTACAAADLPPPPEDRRPVSPRPGVCAVSAMREPAGGGWAKITLVPAALLDRAWSSVELYDRFITEIVLEQGEHGWFGHRLSAPVLTDLRTPPGWLDPTLPPLEGAYRLPWAAGVTWWAIAGWHDGATLDFQPSLTARGLREGHTVFTPNSGHLRELCYDGYQSLLHLRHADGRSTYLLHVSLSPDARRSLLDRPIGRGVALGELIRFAPFRTPCGQGGSRHLHFATSDRALVLDGVRMSAIARVAGCCAAPPTFTAGP